jgi:hypothetical protein
LSDATRLVLLKQDGSTHAGRVRARSRGKHARARDALAFVSNTLAEKQALAVEALRQAAELLVPESTLVRCHGDTWTRVDASIEEVAMGERSALEAVHESLPELLGRVDDAQLLHVLDKIRRPEAPSRKTPSGKEQLGAIREENQIRAKVGLPLLKPISLPDIAKACLPILERIKLQPPAASTVGGGAVESLAKALDTGWVAREEHWGVRVRDRQSQPATESSSKTAPVLTKTRLADNPRRVAHVAVHDHGSTTRQAARRNQAPRS